MTHPATRRSLSARPVPPTRREARARRARSRFRLGAGAALALFAMGTLDDLRGLVMSDIVYPFLTSELVPLIIEMAAALLAP